MKQFWIFDFGLGRAEEPAVDGITQRDEKGDSYFVRRISSISEVKPQKSCLSALFPNLTCHFERSEKS
jgi:hypothetical protein